MKILLYPNCGGPMEAVCWEMEGLGFACSAGNAQCTAVFQYSMVCAVSLLLACALKIPLAKEGAFYRFRIRLREDCLFLPRPTDFLGEDATLAALSEKLTIDPIHENEQARNARTVSWGGTPGAPGMDRPNPPMPSELWTLLATQHNVYLTDDEEHAIAAAAVGRYDVMRFALGKEIADLHGKLKREMLISKSFQEMLRARDSGEIYAKDGLLWRRGAHLPLTVADSEARRHGYQHAEEMVRDLEAKQMSPGGNETSNFGRPTSNFQTDTGSRRDACEFERVSLSRCVRLECGITLAKGGLHDVIPGTNIALEYAEEIPASAIRERVTRREASR